MKAIVLRGYGGPDVLCLEDVPAPKPAADEILIRVRSVSVNRTLDCAVRAGNYPVKVSMPHVLGVDPAGEVVELGAGAEKFKVGDRVATISLIHCMECKQCVKGLEANCLAS
jgi:NADPH:quinone reductase-like Zn-dependent oxidoreductase